MEQNYENQNQGRTPEHQQRNNESAAITFILLIIAAFIGSVIYLIRQI